MSDKQTVLAIDASSEGCSVALAFDGKVWERISTEARSHAQRLLPMIDDMLAEAGTGLGRLDYLALANGPGSFTGIRIALSVAQGLAYGANLPVFCLSSLLTMAWQKQPALQSGSVVVSALDARMGEVYWAAYRLDLVTGLPVVVAAPKVSSKRDLMGGMAALSKQVQAALVGVGSGFAVEGIAGVVLEGLGECDSSIEPNAQALLSLGIKMQPRAEDFVSAENLEPLYLRNEVAWQKRERIRQ